MRKSLRQRLLDEKKGDFKGQTFDSIEELYKLLVDGERPKEDRQANPTQLAFWADPSFAKTYGGPAGCAKTSTGAAEIIVRALCEPGSKMLIARQDYNDLKDTTMLRVEEMLGRLPPGTVVDRDSTPPAKIWLQPIVLNGSQPAELSTITFMGLKSDFGSYEFTGAFIDEADECDQKQIEKVRTRLRHTKGTRYMSLVFNPPDKNNWLYTACTGLDAHDEEVPNGKVFSHHRPNPRENSRNLPSDYYDNMASLPEDLRQRLRDGEWGTVFPGDPVIRQFSRNLHTRRLQYGGGTVFRFMDFGYNRPYCCWAQVTKKGQLQILREFLGFRLEGRAFIREVLRLTAEWFPTARVFKDYGDPAVAQKKDTGSMLALLNEAGIMVMYQHTPFDMSLRALRSRFELLIEGEPAVLIDSRECPVLTGALGGGYHLKDDGVTPMKDGYYDHPVDGLRYGVWNIFGIGQTTSNTSQVTNIAYWSGNHE